MELLFIFHAVHRERFVLGVGEVAGGRMIPGGSADGSCGSGEFEPLWYTNPAAQLLPRNASTWFEV